MHRVVSVTLAAVLLADPVPALGPGDHLGPATWEEARGLLPPEILEHYRTGEYENDVVAWPADDYNWPPDLLAGTKANQGRFVTGERGEVLDRETGTQPPFVIGHPFPDIDPADPAAGVKVIWNFFYRTWYFGNLKAESQINWTNAKGLERRTDNDVFFMYYDGVPERERVPNPQNFLSQDLVVVTAPADLHGTAALTWRYRDPDKRDSAWSYVPAMRRVRAVSPANRSDGFLGSDMNQDDGPFFNGKPEDFVWTLEGQVEQLRVVEELNLKGISESVWMEDCECWRAEWPDLPFLGYMDPEWTGVGWAPIGAALATRPFWVVSAVPRDRYYLYGKLQLYVDAVTFQGAWNRKFSWKGELLNTMQVMAWNPHPFTRPDGKIDYGQGGNMAFQVAENVKMRRATVAGIKTHPKSRFDGRIRFDPAIFDMTALARRGK